MITIFDGVSEYEVDDSDILNLGETHEGELSLDFPEIEGVDVFMTRKVDMRSFELMREGSRLSYVYAYLPASAAEQLAVTIARYMSMAKVTNTAYKLDISALYGYDVPPTDEELEEWKAAVRKEYEAQRKEFADYVASEAKRIVALGEQVAKL